MNEKLAEILRSADAAEAVAKVAAVAEATRAKQAGMSKRALPEWAAGLGDAVSSGAKAVWDDPAGKAGLVGAGAGLLGGGLLSLGDKGRRKRWLSNMLTGGLLGGAIGAGGGMAGKHLLGGGKPAPAGGSPEGGAGGDWGKAPKAPPAERARAAAKAQEGYGELARLGFDDKTLHDAAAGYREGRTGRDEAKGLMEAARPSLGESARNVLPGTWQAAKQLDPFGAANHADVAGLKNVNPLGDHWDTGTAAAAVGANAVARDLQSGGNLRGLLSRAGDRFADSFGSDQTAGLGGGEAGKARWNVPYLNELAGGLRGRHQSLINTELEKKFPDIKDRAAQAPLLGQTLGAGGKTVAPTDASRLDAARKLRTERVYGDKGAYGKAVGVGALPTLALLAPMIAREWGGHGYRSGEKPIMSVLDANKVLQGG